MKSDQPKRARALHIAGKSHAEIAAELGIEPDAVAPLLEPAGERSPSAQAKRPPVVAEPPPHRRTDSEVLLEMNAALRHIPPSAVGLDGLTVSGGGRRPGESPETYLRRRDRERDRTATRQQYRRRVI